MAHAMPARRGADVMQSVTVQAGAEPFAADGGPVGVLVCHGFTGYPRTVRPWAEHLAAAGLTVRAPRLPGHGTTWRDLNRTGWVTSFRCRAVVFHIAGSVAADLTGTRL